MSPAPAYDVRNLRKIYRHPPVVANDSLTFEVRAGEAFGLLGPNGAGKTTLIRQLVGLLRPTAGEITLFGERLGRGRSDARRVGRTVAYLPQGSLAQGEWKVGEAIAWTAMLRGCPRRMADSEVAELLGELNLTSVADRQIRKLSGGQRRLVQLAMTLVGRLPILILDEPTTDIDPSMRKTIWRLIRDRASAGAAVILVTHDVAEAEHALERVAVIDGGKLVTSGTPAELKARLAQRIRIEAVVADGAEDTVHDLANLLGAGATVDGRRVSGWVPPDGAALVLEKLVGRSGEGLEDIRMVTPTLEDVYLSATGHHLDTEPQR